MPGERGKGNDAFFFDSQPQKVVAEQPMAAAAERGRER